MNIRFENDLRVRLDETEMECLLAGRALTRRFRLAGVFDFSVSIRSVAGERSRLAIGDGTLGIFLDGEDLLRLRQPDLRKQGVRIGEVRVQADLFQAEKRARHEAAEEGRS